MESADEGATVRSHSVAETEALVSAGGAGGRSAPQRLQRVLAASKSSAPHEGQVQLMLEGCCFQNAASHFIYKWETVQD